MSDKKIKILGMTIYKRKAKGNKTKTSVLGLPVWKKVSIKNKKKYYLLGFRVWKKKIKSTNIKQNETIGHADEWYNLDHKKLNVVIKFSGGLGDLIVGVNYTLKLIKYINDKDIKVYFCGSTHLLKFLYRNQDIIHILSEDDLNDNCRAFDVFIKLVRFPQILYAKKEKVAEYSEKLLDYIFKHEKFAVQHPRFFKCGRTCDGQINMLSLLYGKNRVQTPDILNIFGIEDIDFNIPIPQNKSLNLDYSIVSSKYITVHRGNDARQSSNCVKLWPIGYYNILVRKLKEKYPQYQIVQLGVSKDRCPDIENVDVNLVGKTSLDDVAFLLKNSTLHIDCEGGFAHLRHAIKGGKTVVLFGPTDISYYGYPENINLRTNACKACEWVKEKWMEKCSRGMHNPACMYSLTPEFVFSKINESEVLNEEM